MKAHYDPEAKALYVQVAEKDGRPLHTWESPDGTNVDWQGDQFSSDSRDMQVVGYEFLLDGPLDILTATNTGSALALTFEHTLRVKPQPPFTEPLDDPE